MGKKQPTKKELEELNAALARLGEKFLDDMAEPNPKPKESRG